MALARLRQVGRGAALLAIVLACMAAFPMPALADDPPESGVTNQYPLSTAALVAGATAAAADIARRALKRERERQAADRRIADLARRLEDEASPDVDLEDLEIQR